MREFCWSLPSLNVNRFRLAFALKKKKTNKTKHFFGFISEITFFTSETSNELYFKYWLRCRVWKWSPVSPKWSPVPPSYLCSGTLTPALAFCCSGVTKTLDIGESFQPEPPPKGGCSPPPRGLLFRQDGGWGMKLFLWRIPPPHPPRMSLCHSDTSYKVPGRI